MVWVSSVALVVFALIPTVVFAADGDAAVVVGDDPINTQLVLLSGVVGFFVPALLAVINRYNWSSQAKAICTFVVSVVVAFLTTWIGGDIDSKTQVVTAILTVFSAAIMFYHRWWKPSEIAPEIEKATG